MELKKSQNDIVKVGFGLNILVGLISIFYSPYWLFLTTVLVNILLLGTYMIFTKYYFMFAGISAANRFAGIVSNKLEGLNGKILE